MNLTIDATETVPVESLTPYPDNPRRGNLELISDSLKQNGQFAPIVVQRSTGFVLAGNHTFLAAKELGWAEIQVAWVDVDDAAAKRILLASNRTADQAGYDDELLASLLENMPDLAGTGYDEDDVAALLDSISGDPQPGLTDPDDAPQPPTAPVTEAGDEWLLGPHKVLCGDSTEDAIATVMGGTPVDFVFTDPPYGVDVQGRDEDQQQVQGRRKDGKGVSNEDLSRDDLPGFLAAALGEAYEHCRPGAAWYVCSPPGDLLCVFGSVLMELEGTWRHTLVWVKDHVVMGRADYHYRHEVIFYGWKAGAAHTWEGDRSQDSVWEIERPSRSPEHPTMKPVELIERALANSSVRRGVVLDPFAGSGSTLIAVHRKGRVASLVELDPAYVDVTCRRWQEHTG